MRIVGLGSGTSVDAIDVAAAAFGREGDDLVLTPLGDRSVPWSPGLRGDILDVLPPAPSTVADVCRLDARIGQDLAGAARRGIEDLCAGEAQLVVSHGQTVYHWIDGDRALGTLQLGGPAWIAEATGVPVLSDVRSRDIAAGGHGAPLVGIFDALLLGGDDGPVAALNLGGIANLTALAAGRDPIAFDVGPANALLDAALRVGSANGEPFDDGGRRAARGRVDEGLLALLLDEPYYRQPPPKSTGKERFHAGYLAEALRRAPVPALDDLLATLVELTARIVADACRAHGVRTVVVSGGGVHNAALMSALRERIAPAGLETSDAHGIPPDAKEAYAFALLGWLTWHGLAGTLAGCTGARHESILGSLTGGAGPLRLPEPAARPVGRLRVERPVHA